MAQRCFLVGNRRTYRLSHESSTEWGYFCTCGLLSTGEAESKNGKHQGDVDPVFVFKQIMIKMNKHERKPTCNKKKVTAAAAKLQKDSWRKTACVSK